VEPDVTLTMAAWRPEPAWLLEAVRSGLDNHGCSIELVVVDDGSPEPVADLLSGVTDPRLRIVRIDHAGTAAARNAGIEHAHGRMIRFLDADDVVAPESTATLASLIGDAENVVAYGATVVCDEELRPVRTIASELEGDVVVPCLLGRFDVRHVSMVFPRRVVEQAGPWAEGFAVSPDWDFVLRAVEHAKVRSDSGPATYYRRHSSSQSRTVTVEEGERDRHRVLDGYFDRHPDARGTRLERSARAAADLDRAAAYAAVGERRLAARRLARAARSAPLGAAQLGARLVTRTARNRA
jgi:glycosyltransferase involved in cell wall biosynthesis